MCDSPGRVYMWQNNMCISYTLVFKRFEDFFIANGWEIADDPGLADCLVLGACAGFLPQIDDYMEKIGLLNTLDKNTVIYGCLPKVTPQDFKASTPRFDLFVPPQHPEHIEKLIPDAKVRWAEIADRGIFRKEDYRRYDLGKRFLVVQHGCEAKCVYCPHKIGMGPRISRPRDEVLGLARRALDEGAHTLFLEGMDSGSYGTDFEPALTYLDILNPILEMPGDFQVHIGQFGANWVLHYGQELVDAFSNPRVTDIKIPIQAVSPRLLKLMGRDPRVLELGPLLSELRSRNPKLVLRTDLIIGFPTETPAELNRTLEFVARHFTEVAVFGFELHPNTKIARMHLPMIDQYEVDRRVQHAVEYLGQYPNIITHRGGQVCETLIEREKRKVELGL